MDNQNPLMNIGDLAKPATTLIEKISDAIGGIFRPAQIKRVAEAEAQAEKIRAVAQIEITDLQQRAVARFFMEEAIKQNNMESITRLALPLIKEDAKPEQVNNDWIAQFFDNCRLISDVDMQILWARVLSGQANSPGAYSKRTLGILSNLEKGDAILFSTLCNYSVFLGSSPYPLIYELNNKVYTNHGITFEVLAHLESLGLLHFNHASGYVLHGFFQKQLFYYFELPMVIGFRDFSENVFQLGKVILTQAGRQLFQVCEVEPIDGFPIFLKERWESFGYEPEPIDDQKFPTEEDIQSFNIHGETDPPDEFSTSQ